MESGGAEREPDCMSDAMNVATTTASETSVPPSHGAAPDGGSATTTKGLGGAPAVFPVALGRSAAQEQVLYSGLEFTTESGSGGGFDEATLVINSPGGGVSVTSALLYGRNFADDILDYSC